jgi:biopolymer transport protein ExbB
MVGLLGTVISMIGTFNAIKDTSGGGGVASQAGAIGLALFATAMGLVTAIPLVFTHVLFKAWVARFEVQMKSSAQKLLLLLQAAKSGPTKGAGTAPGAKPGVDSAGIVKRGTAAP